METFHPLLANGLLQTKFQILHYFTHKYVSATERYFEAAAARNWLKDFKKLF